MALGMIPSARILSLPYASFTAGMPNSMAAIRHPAADIRKWRMSSRAAMLTTPLAEVKTSQSSVRNAESAASSAATFSGGGGTFGDGDHAYGRDVSSSDCRAPDRGGNRWGHARRRPSKRGRPSASARCSARSLPCLKEQRRTVSTRP